MREMLAALTVAMAVAGCGGINGPGPHVYPTDSSSTSTAAPAPVAAPPSPHYTTPALPTANFSDEADEQYLAAIAAKGVPVDDPDQMTLAGYGVCGMLNDPDSKGLIDATAWVMDVYELTGPQATAVSGAAVDVYCPGSAPR